MRNVGFGQILVLVFLCFLLFGDFSSFKKKLIDVGKQINNYLSKNDRKKGS